MNKPTVVLKNIKTFIGMEGQGFNAEVYINGVKCMLAIDDANGGCFNYQEHTYNNPKADVVKANIKLLEDYLKSLGEYPLEIDGKICERDGKPIMMNHDMDSFINDLLEVHFKAKDDKKKEKLMETAILIGKPNSGNYSYFKQRVPLASFQKNVLQSFINDIKSRHCKDGVVILNTNLAKLGLVV